MLASAGRSVVASPAAHPSYHAVSSVCITYPTQAAALLQTYLDLTHAAAAWQEVESCELRSGPSYPPGSDDALHAIADSDAENLVAEELAQWQSSCARLGLAAPHSSLALAALIGRHKDSKKFEVIVPLSVSHHLEPAQIEQIFGLVEALAAQRKTDLPVETDHILLSIIAQDSTLVYYRLSKGMIKPVN